MTATIGTDHALWQDNVGFFPPGTALANDAGIGVLKGPRDLDRVWQGLAADGYKGEKIAFVVPADMPGVSGMSDVCAGKAEPVIRPCGCCRTRNATEDAGQRVPVGGPPQ